MFTPSNPIFKASYEGQLRVIRDYVSEGGSINAVDKWNNTALHWAAKGNQYAVLKFLVDNGVEVDAENSEGETALHWSTYSNNACHFMSYHSVGHHHFLFGDEPRDAGQAECAG